MLTGVWPASSIELGRSERGRFHELLKRRDRERKGEREREESACKKRISNISPTVLGEGGQVFGGHSCPIKMCIQFNE